MHMRACVLRETTCLECNQRKVHDLLSIKELDIIAHESRETGGDLSEREGGGGGGGGGRGSGAKGGGGEGVGGLGGGPERRLQEEEEERESEAAVVKGVAT